MGDAELWMDCAAACLQQDRLSARDDTEDKILELVTKSKKRVREMNFDFENF